MHGKKEDLKDRKARQYETMAMPSHFKKLQTMEDVGSAGFSHMVYAMYFGAMKGDQFVKAASMTMNVIPDDDGVDFFTGVLEQLDDLVRNRMLRDLPGTDLRIFNEKTGYLAD